MKRCLFALVLLCAVAQPAFAQDVVKDRAPPPTPQEMRDLRAQTTAYGAWLVRLNAAASGANQELGAIQAEWQAAMQLRSSAAAIARFRPALARAIAKVADAKRQVLALDKPDFPELKLDDDLRPAQLVVETVQLLDRMTVLLNSFEPLMTAMSSGNVRAVEQSGSQMLDAARLLLENQALMAGAGLVTTERDSGAYYLQHFQERLFRSAARVLGTARQVMFGRTDPAAAEDFDAFATEIVDAARQGRAKMTAEIAHFEGVAASATAAGRGDTDAVRVLRKSAAVLRIDLVLFDSADIYGAALHAAAAKARAGKLDQQALLALLAQYRATGEEIKRVAAAEAQAMAAE